jgi:hypothetical protein
VRTTVLGISLGANVLLLIGLVGVLVLSHMGPFAPSGSPGASTPGVALSTATATSSPTPQAGWLQVVPSSVQLSCAEGQRTQVVVLENTGPQQVAWRAVVAGSADQTGVTVTPNRGELGVGASRAIQLQIITHASDSQTAASQQGVVTFAPTSAAAGPSPSLSYTIVGCS